MHDDSIGSHEEFFKHTSRRWLYNEEARLQERYVKFNVSELQRAAARAVQRDRCVEISKLAEGGFNKVFLLTMDDGFQVIARLPTPVAGPRHLTTASEVATMNFLENVLNLSVPKVYDYSNTSSNPVGAEYMIIEMIQGESIESRWLSLSAEDIKDLMTQVVRMEEKIFSFQWPAYGSIYHKKDVSQIDHVEIGVGDFCIGPIAKRSFWLGDRANLKIERGPWKTAVECVTAPARCEMLWTSIYGKPQPRRTWSLETEHNIDPSEHIKLLSQYLSVAPYIIPKDPELSVPILRHPDLSLANILLAPDSNKICSFIDWQDASVLPLFMQAGYPFFCENDGSKPQSLKIPQLPENFEQLSEEDQHREKVEHHLKLANLHWATATGLYNQTHLKALQIPGLSFKQYLLTQSAYPWDADLINLRRCLVEFYQNWSEMSSDPCPLSFSKGEQELARKESVEWNEGAAIRATMRELMQMDFEGGVYAEDYDVARQVNAEMRLEMVKNAAPHERVHTWQTYPFKDDADESLPPSIEDSPSSVEEGQ